jgi:Mlc titration factor MtfA (ptsG expression regulator)
LTCPIIDFLVVRGRLKEAVIEWGVRKRTHLDDRILRFLEDKQFAGQRGAVLDDRVLASVAEDRSVGVLPALLG